MSMCVSNFNRTLYITGIFVLSVPTMPNLTQIKAVASMQVLYNK